MTAYTRRTFHVLDVVTVADGRLVAPSGIGAVYELCGHVLGDENLFTHQLPAAADAATPTLLAQFPWIADLDSDADLTNDSTRDVWCEWIIAHHGEWVDVEPAEDPQWRKGRAIQDLIDMVGEEKVITVVVPGDC